MLVLVLVVSVPMPATGFQEIVGCPLIAASFSCKPFLFYTISVKEFYYFCLAIPITIRYEYM